VLEDANLQIDAELSDMLGKSGRAILDALAAGEADPVRLAALAHRYVKPRKPSWLTRREGAPHHRSLLRLPQAGASFV
jgi:transposase